MSEVERLEKQREEILAAMGRIGDMRRGSVSEQYFEIHLKGQPEPVRRGPYWRTTFAPILISLVNRLRRDQCLIFLGRTRRRKMS